MFWLCDGVAFSSRSVFVIDYSRSPVANLVIHVPHRQGFDSLDLATDGRAWPLTPFVDFSPVLHREGGHEPLLAHTIVDGRELGFRSYER